MSRTGFTIDEIFDLLEDSQWHSFSEAEEELSFPQEKIEKAMRFLAEFNYLKIENEKAKVNKDTLKWVQETEESLF